MSSFQPPPTWADLVLIDPKTNKGAFNPIWLDWFISLTQNVGTTGPVTSVTASSPLASSGGTSPNISISSSTGSGPVVLATGATLVTPNIGVASATSIAVGGGTALTGETGQGTNIAQSPTASTVWTPTDASGAGLALTVSGEWWQVGFTVFAALSVTYPITASGLTAAIGSFPITFPNRVTSGFSLFGFFTGGTALEAIPVGGTATVNFRTLAGGTGQTNAQMSTLSARFMMIYASA